MNERALTRLAMDVYRGMDDDTPHDPTSDYTLSGCSLTADDVLRLACDLKADAGVQWTFAIPERTYRHMKWWRHCSKAYALPSRKVRKCIRRRMQRRKNRERRMYR